MAIYLLTSMFDESFNKSFTNCLKSLQFKTDKFVFVASDFYSHHTTDNYFHYFYNMFLKENIKFTNTSIIDSRMTPEQAQSEIFSASVLWLSGGDTKQEYEYWKEYNLLDAIKQYNGIVIGMSAGTLNLAKTVVCSTSFENDEQITYTGIGAVDITVKSHFDENVDLEKLKKVSQQSPFYLMTDESFIVCNNEKTEFYGDIYKMEHGILKKVPHCQPLKQTNWN